jgi:protein TonB
MRARSSLLILPLIALLAGGAGKDLSSRAKGNLAAAVSDADYPPSAIRAGAQGIVAFELDVADGRVSACRATSSSGSPILDSTTCRIMIARMQFTPAHNRKGRPTTDRIHNRMKWVLPQKAPVLPPLEPSEAMPMVPADAPPPGEDSNEETPAEAPPS